MDTHRLVYCSSCLLHLYYWLGSSFFPFKLIILFIYLLYLANLSNR